jgi:hypothetical protein
MPLTASIGNTRRVLKNRAAANAVETGACLLLEDLDPEYRRAARDDEYHIDIWIRFRGVRMPAKVADMRKPRVISDGSLDSAVTTLNGIGRTVAYQNAHRMNVSICEML